MSLDVSLEVVRPCEIYSANITHNLTEMAEEAGLYEPLWHPEKLNITHAKQLIAPLQKGLALLLAEPDRFKAFDPPNGWGSYGHLVSFTKDYLDACGLNPEATVSVSR